MRFLRNRYNVLADEDMEDEADAEFEPDGMTDYEDDKMGSVAERYFRISKRRAKKEANYE